MAPARDKIIEAALALVAEQGLAGVTMVAVARRAGVARATLYKHYSDVPSILAEAAQVHQHEAIDGLGQAMAVVSGPIQRLEHLVRYVASISTHGHTLTTHHGFPPELGEQLATFDTELERHIAQALADGVAAGDFRADLDVDTTSVLVRHALVGVSELVAAHPDRAAAVTDTAIATLVAAVSTQPEDTT